jgi:signal transduction histidine kinase
MIFCAANLNRQWGKHPAIPATRVARFRAQYRLSLWGWVGAAMDEMDSVIDGLAGHRGNSPGVGSRVLVVDDDESVAVTISEVLRRDGYVVDTALSGARAIERIKLTDYDLVLTDLHMEGVDGMRVLEEVRRRSAMTITIVITGYASLESAISAMRHGAYDYLIKPTVIEDMKLTLRRGVEHRRLMLAEREAAVRLEQLILAEREARARLEQLNNELESRIAEATSELRKANDDLQQASRAKDVFFATLSHELRNPLTPILGWARLLRSAPHEENFLRRGIDVIERNADLLNNLIGDLLDVSRIISGKLQFNLEPTDVSVVARAVVEGMRDKSAARGIQLQTDIPAKPVTVNGNALRLHQVVANLLSNAVKFTPSGGRVSVSLRREYGQAMIVVSDTGVGMDTEFLLRAFELFSQAGESGLSKYEGLGLGLAIVRKLTELQGGWVRAESDGLGKGSTFIVGLPCIDSVPSDGALDAEHKQLVIDKTVLIVEDSPDSADLLTMIFRQAGCPVIAVHSAEEALRLLPSAEPGLIVSDIGLKGISGNSFIQEVRRLPEFIKTPAIALSGFASLHDRDEALAAGFDAHLAKPIEPDALLKLARKLIP